MAEDESCSDSGRADAYAEFHPGRSRRIQLTGKHRGCHQCAPAKQCRYTVDILDAKDGTEIKIRSCVFLVPPKRGEEWLFTSTQGQWQVVNDTKAARLIMVALVGNDHDNELSHMKDDIFPFVRRFLPLACRSNGADEYLTDQNGIKVRRTLALVRSPTTGSILVEDVAIASRKSQKRKANRAVLKCYRRLSFQRNPNMIQSEALLVRDIAAGTCKSKARRVGEQTEEMFSSKRFEAEVFQGLKVDHSCLTNEYHEGMIAALILIAEDLEQWLVAKEEIRVMILGLGAGLLPMFVHNHIPVEDIQVVELDQMVGEIAKDHFGFVEDQKMKLQIGDGIVAVKAIAAAVSPVNGRDGTRVTDSRLHVLIVDTDSKDPSNGSSCPAPECLEDSFLLAVKEALREGGMLVVNVVASAKGFHAYSKSQLKRFFVEVYEIEVDRDVCRILIAMAHPKILKDLANTPKDLARLEKMITGVGSLGANIQKLARNLKRVN